jgi:ParB-like chromosome segregation protein Spo0J
MFGYMKIENTRIDLIKPYPHNPRKNDKTIVKVSKSIQKHGWQQPIVVDRDGVIVVGHTRYGAAKKLGLSEVPVIWARDMSEDQARAYRIMDNRSHDLTKWDIVELKAEMDDLPDLEATGFSLKELDDILFPEAGLIGKNEKYRTKNYVVIECDSMEDLEKIQSQIKEKGFLKCRKNYY